MDLLSLLTGIVGNRNQPQARTSAPASRLPNKRQIPLNSPYNATNSTGTILYNVDRPASLPYFTGQLPTPQVQTNLNQGDITSAGPIYAPGYQPNLPDHQYHPDQMRPVRTLPARGDENFLRMLLNPRTRRS